MPPSDPSLHRLHVKIPINLPLLAIPLLKPSIRLLKVLALKPAPTGTQRAGMHTHQHTMPLLIHLANPLPCRRSPRQEHHPSHSLLINNFNNFLRELLPASVCVGICFVSADREAGVQEEDAAVGPGGQQTTLIWGWGEGGIVILEAGVDVFQGRGSRGGRANREGEAMGLVEVVVRVLAKDNGLDRVEGGVAGPIAAVLISLAPIDMATR